jgi:hypothetical protein
MIAGKTRVLPWSGLITKQLKKAVQLVQEPASGGPDRSIGIVARLARCNRIVLHFTPNRAN